MSLFENTKLPCPICGDETNFNAVHSVNVDRAPELREQIVEGTFQQEACGACGKAFRMDPQFTYVDLGRKQWVAVYGTDELEAWRTTEEEVQSLFNIAFGSGAPKPAQDLAVGIQPRLVFGWSALWELLAIQDAGLDDLQVQLLKLGLLRNMEDSPFALDSELRFLEIPEDGPQELSFAWVNSESAEFIQGFRIPRALYDEITENPDQWKALRSELDGQLFMDMQRLVTVGT